MTFEALADTVLGTLPEARRIETYDKDRFQLDLMDWTHSVYPHQEVYGDYCTVQEYIDAPPRYVFDYMNRSESLNEWTYSVRDLSPTAEDPTLYEGLDRIGGETKIFCRTLGNEAALTVDYHCAWDQGDHLWMIYLNRILPAEMVLDRSGSVVIWTNCRHPFYLKNPRPELAPKRPIWVGEFWPWFFAGHRAEILTLKSIIEYRYRKEER